jgi:hypothetical protein
VGQYVINSTENILVLTLASCVSQISIELAIVQDALEVSIVLRISFEHPEVTLLIFRIISGVYVSLLLPVVFPMRSNLLFSFPIGLISLLSDLRNCWIGKVNKSRSETLHSH